MQEEIIQTFTVNRSPEVAAMKAQEKWREQGWLSGVARD